MGRRSGLVPHLVHFGERLCREFAQMGVPLKVSYPDVDTYSLEVEHCILGDDLPALCWAMIAAKAAWVAHAEGVDFRWSNGTPGQIELDNLVIGIGVESVKLDPRWRLVNHKWVFVDDPDAVVTHY